MRTVDNDRGLGTYLVALDANGEYFRVQDSSAGMEPCVWIFTKQKTGEHMGQDMHAALHLTIDGVVALMEALHAFIEHATSDERGAG